MKELSSNAMKNSEPQPCLPSDIPKKRVAFQLPIHSPQKESLVNAKSIPAIGSFCGAGCTPIQLRQQQPMISTRI